MADRTCEEGRLLSVEYGGRRCRPHHESSRTKIQGCLRRSRARLHGGPHQCERADASTLSLVLRDSAIGVEASPGIRAQQGDGTLRAAKYSDLPDVFAAGLAVH